MEKKGALIFLLISTLLMGCKEGQPITADKAEQLATLKLAEYAKQNGLEVNQFAAPKISYSESTNSWDVSYKTTTVPPHLVNFIVGKDGSIETSRMIGDGN